jgi:phosphate transport system permease protein
MPVSTRTLPPDSESAVFLRRVSKRRDYFFYLCWGAAAGSVALLFWIVAHITYDAWPAIRMYGLSLIYSSEWNANFNRFGVLPYVLGTAVSALIAMMIALPLGVLIAIFLSEDFLPHTLRHVFRFLIELLAAIPSVVFGLWGIAVVIPLVQSWGGELAGTVGKHVPLFAGPAYGNSLLTASLVLSLMILPTITAISRNSLQAVPHVLREGAYALGATRWETIFGVLLPTAAPGVIASAILATGRAMGETMAVAMLIGNSSRLSWSLLSPAGTLAGLLANQFAEAEGMVINTLMYVAVILMLMTLLVNIIGDRVLVISMRKVKGLI